MHRQTPSQSPLSSCDFRAYRIGIELTALKYEQGIQTRTDERFFGMKTSFKKNVLRKLRKHRM